MGEGCAKLVSLHHPAESTELTRATGGAATASKPLLEHRRSPVGSKSTWPPRRGIVSDQQPSVGHRAPVRSFATHINELRDVPEPIRILDHCVRPSCPFSRELETSGRQLGLNSQRSRLDKRVADPRTEGNSAIRSLSGHQPFGHSTTERTNPLYAPLCRSVDTLFVEGKVSMGSVLCRLLVVALTTTNTLKTCTLGLHSTILAFADPLR